MVNPTTAIAPLRQRKNPLASQPRSARPLAPPPSHRPSHRPCCSLRCRCHRLPSPSQDHLRAQHHRLRRQHPRRRRQAAARRSCAGPTTPTTSRRHHLLRRPQLRDRLAARPQAHACRPPPSSTPSRIAGAKGLNPEDYDASRWPARLQQIAQIAAAHDTSRRRQDTVAQFDTAMTICVMRYISDLRIGRVNPQHFNFDINVADKKYDLAEFVSDNAVDAGDVPALIRKVEPDSDQYRATEAALAHYLSISPCCRPPLLRRRCPTCPSPASHPAAIVRRNRPAARPPAARRRRARRLPVPARASAAAQIHTPPQPRPASVIWEQRPSPAPSACCTASGPAVAQREIRVAAIAAPQPGVQPAASSARLHRRRSPTRSSSTSIATASPTTAS